MSSNPPVVVCATDFSERASQAAAVAAKIALGLSEPLLLVHVSQSGSAEERAQLKTRLDLEAKSLGGNGAVVEAVVLEGDRPADTFLEFVHAQRPTLLVVASETQGPVDRWALGSFSEQVAEAATVPTLVLRNPGSFHEWDWNGRSLKVLVALDLHAGSDQVLRWIKELGRAGPYDVVPCHVHGNGGQDGGAGDTPRIHERLQRELKKEVRDQLGIDVATAIVKSTAGDIAHRLIESAREVSADLIAAGTHQRHGISRLFHGSVSRQLLHEAGVNVVCVPTGATFDPRNAHIPEFRRVLVATDFSPLGNAAIPFACAACCVGGLVRIVHVEKPSRQVAPLAAAELRNRLRELIPVETGARCQPPEVGLLADRTPANAICAEADRFGADLVCLSSHGLGASTALHGSVTKAVLKKIRRPVLVIRRPEK